MKPTPLHTPAADAQADIVAILKEALARAEQGEFLDVALFARMRGSEVHVRISDPCDRMLLVGCLERAKFELLSELESGEAK